MFAYIWWDKGTLHYCSHGGLEQEQQDGTANSQTHEGVKKKKTLWDKLL